MEFDFTKEPGLVLKNKESVSPELALISIITPFYNAGKYFEQTFNSVMNQTFPWFEWIIIDDGTTQEEDLAILAKFEKRDQRVRVIHQKNGGLSNARNVGFREAKTDIVIPLDADDVIAPQYVEYLYWGLYYNKDAAWCYTCSTGFHAQEYLWKFPWSSEKLKTYNFMNYCAAIRKKDAAEIGGYKVEKWSYYEDWRFWLEMVAAKKKPVHLGSYLFWYRRLDNGMLATINKDPERVAFCDNIIKTAASKITEEVQAIEYPLRKTAHPYYRPEVIDFGENYRIKNSNGKIRLMLLIPWMVLGGADKFNLDLVAGLDKNKYDISILTTASAENEWGQKFEAYTDEIYHLPDFLDPAYYAEFVSYYINTRMVDIVLVTNSYRGYYMIPWLRKNFPNLCIIDYVHMEEWYWKAGGYARTSGMFGDLVNKTYVCNSETRKVMLNYFKRKPETVKTLYIGVDQEKFDRNKVESGFLYKKLNLEPDAEIVLFPCRITPQKRPFMLLDIAEKVHEKRKSVVFVVVGDGEQLEELKQQITQRKLDKVVQCIGRTDEMDKCYRDTKITLVCSLKEGLSLTAYESCSMSVPVISSDVGGQHDLIDDTVGKIIPTGHMEHLNYDDRKFDSNEVNEYVDAIIDLLGNEERYDQCSKNCRKKIENGFSTIKMIEKFDSEVTEILQDGKARNRNLEQSKQLQEMGLFADEMYTMQLAEEEREQEAAIIWNERCWFERRLGEEIDQKKQEQAYVYELQGKIKKIQNSRAWRIIQKYYYFASENRVGKLMRRVLKRIYNIFRK